MSPQKHCITLWLTGLTFTALHTDAAEQAYSGCSNENFVSGVYAFEDQQKSRTYRIHIPAGHEGGERLPLILWFHGWGGDESELLDQHDVQELLDEAAFILVAPRGLGSDVPDTRLNSWTFNGSATGLDGDGINEKTTGDSEAICDFSLTPNYSYPSCAEVATNSCSWTHCQADDTEFVLALIEEIDEKACIDRNNVYAGGGSNGGMFTWHLGQDPRVANKLRAIAPIIGLPHRGYSLAPGSIKPLPAIVVTSTDDKVVPPGVWEDTKFTTSSNQTDRFFYTSATAITQEWAEAHQCDTDTPARQVSFPTYGFDCRSYCQNHDKQPGVMDCRAELGHEYGLPESWQLILNFFQSHADNASP